jgi:hypothetical protein
MTNPITSAESLQAVNDTLKFEAGASNDAGTLTGTETIAISRGTGLLQTTSSALATLTLSSIAPQRQSVPVTANGQAAYPTLGYSVGVVNVFVAGIRLNPSQYTALDGINITITDPLVLAKLVPGMTVDIDASISIAVSGVATPASVQAMDPANNPAIGTLTGAELVLTRQGSGLFQTTFTKLAAYINGLINPTNLNNAAALTGTELVPLSQSGGLVRSTLTSLVNFVLQQLPASNNGTLLTDTGAANVYSATNPVPLITSTWITGVQQEILVAHTNTGASTYAPDGLTPIPILGNGFKALTGGEMLAGGIAQMIRLTATGINSGNPFALLLNCTGAPQQVAPGVTTAQTPTLGQVQTGSTNVGVDTGTANTYVVAFSPALTAPVPWAPFWFEVNTTNTGASTLNAAGSVQPLVGAAHLALQGGELVAKGNALVYWNPTLASGAGSYVLLLCSGAPEQVAPATQPSHGVQLSQLGQGQCRLSVASTTSLLLSPYNGNNVVVNGLPEQIPAGGLTLSNSGLQAPVVGSSYSITSNVCTYTTSTAHGLVVGARACIQKSFSGVLNGNWIVLSVPTATTFTFAVTTANVTSQAESGASVQPIYYVYLGTVSSVLTLLADQIGYAIQTNGIATKSTDTTKSLVGMFMTNSSNQFVSGLGTQFVLNWFNRRNLDGFVGVTPGTTFTNTASAEISTTTRCPFLCWADDIPRITVNGTVTCNTAAAGEGFQLMIDANITGNAYSAGVSLTFPTANSGAILTCAGAYLGGNEGYHTSVLVGYVTAGTGTLANCRTDITIFG